MNQYPNSGQNPYGQPQPGNSGQYPNPGQNPYGQPQPGNSGQYPNPNTGQNPYGQPQPGYPPQYPGTGQNPYGQPPTGYPGTAPYGQPPTGYGAPPTLAMPPTPQRNNRVVAGVIGGAVVLLIVIVSIIHVNSATGTIKGFYDDFFNYNYNSAFSRICADKQSAVKAEFDATENSLNQFKTQATFDTSLITYKLKSGGLTSAVVTVGGILGGTVSGIKNSAPIPNTDISLNASGLGWCINVLPTTGTSSGS